MQTQQINVYALVLILISVVVIVAFGGGLFNQPTPWLSQWQHQSFWNLCHQIPDRSFWLNGQPMAVCSRCMGIYSGFALGWLLLPMWAMMKLPTTWPMKNVALFILVINFFDIVGNILGFWENTLVSRLALGSLMGISAALIFTGDFFKINIQLKGNHHGRITESGIGK